LHIDFKFYLILILVADFDILDIIMILELDVLLRQLEIFL